MPRTILCPTKSEEENRILAPWWNQGGGELSTVEREATKINVSCPDGFIYSPAPYLWFFFLPLCWVVATFGGGASTSFFWRRRGRGLCDRPKKLGAGSNHFIDTFRLILTARWCCYSREVVIGNTRRELNFRTQANRTTSTSNIGLICV